METLGLVKARAGKPAAAAARDFLMALPHVEFTHPTELHEALQIQGEHPGLSIVDASVLWHCRRLGVRAATFDRQLMAKSRRPR